MCTLDHVEIFYACLLQTEKKKKDGLWKKIWQFWLYDDLILLEEERRAEQFAFANHVDGVQKAD